MPFWLSACVGALFWRMPELPEVETVRRSLANLAGQKLLAARVVDGRLRFPVSGKNFTPLLGKKLTELGRRGKYLVLHFGSELLVVHLGMTGRLLINAPKNKFTKVEFQFSSDRLSYIDVRRFGFLLTGKAAQISLPKGADAYSAEVKQAAALIHNSRSPVKTVLLNQKIISGIGNIYASEILFSAGIHPQRIASGLTGAELRKLFSAVRRVLGRAIAAKGSSISDFVYALPGEDKFSTGYYQKQFLVYSRDGKPCRRCGALIVRTVMANRATFFCPHCQAL